MKNLNFVAAALAALLMGACCNNQAGKSEETLADAVNKYLVEEIGPSYASGEYCIPVTVYSVADESKSDDITVAGDFWVLNYVQAGDTLKNVSGGNHPGKIHFKKDKDGHYEVTGFDAVADGSGYLPSAQSIFGDLFEEFSKAQSDDVKRGALIKEAISAYVKERGISVSCYQDYCWPAVPIE